jgi:hypothetical protein
MTDTPPDWAKLQLLARRNASTKRAETCKAAGVSSRDAGHIVASTDPAELVEMVGQLFACVAALAKKVRKLEERR